jgi:hypothetical protein
MTDDVKVPPEKPNYLGAIVRDMIHRAGLSGRPTARTLSGGAALLVIVRGDEVRLVVSRAGQPLGHVELRTFARMCVPEGAVRWPAEDQNCVKKGAGLVWRVGWKWTITVPA